MATLEALYYGNIIPQEYSCIYGSAYSELLGYIVRHQNDLKPTLTEQQKEIFEKLKDCESELHGMNELGAFLSGFKLATRKEILSNSSHISCASINNSIGHTSVT